MQRLSATLLPLVAALAFTAQSLTSGTLAAPAANAAAAGYVRDGKADVASLGRPSFKIFNDSDGLPQNTISAVTHDNRGYLWVATQDGAAYYNGRVWTVVNMPDRSASNYVNTICASSDGAIWFGTDQAGIVILKKDQWTSITEAAGLPDNSIRSIVEEQGPNGPVMWVATGDGVATVEDGKVSAVTGSGGVPFDDVTCLAIQRDQTGAKVVWVGTRTGLHRIENRAVTPVVLPGIAPGTEIASLCETEPVNGASSLLVCTGLGLVRFENNIWSPIPLPLFPDMAIRAACETTGPSGSRTLWVGSNRGGVARLDRGVWTVIDIDEGFPNNEITCILNSGGRNASHTLWIGTNGGGIVRLRLQQWLSYGLAAGLPDKAIRSFLDTSASQGRESIWIGTRAGIAHYIDGRCDVHDLEDGLPGRGVRAIVEVPEADGSRAVWAATNGGVSKLEGARWVKPRLPIDLPSTDVLCLLPVQSPTQGQTLWIGTGGGLAYLSPARNVVYTTQNGLPDVRIACLLATRSSDGIEMVWAGTNGGLAKYTDGAWTVYTSENGLANNVVLSLLEEQLSDGRRRLWIGTYGGLSVIDPDSRTPAWTSFNDLTSPALPNNTIYRLERDRGGRIYAFTNKGVARFTDRVPTGDDPSEFSIYTYTTEDGLPSNEVNIGASMVDSYGRIWAGTVNGAAMLDPEFSSSSTPPAPLVIERTQVNDRPVAIDGDWDLAHDENHIVVEFALLSYFRENDTRYRTQLAGFDAQLTPWTSDPKRDFSNLPRGNYTFNLWAKDYSGRIVGPVSFEFRIAPAPWHTWWAYAAYAAMIVLAGYAAVQTRLRSLRNKNVQLEDRIRLRTEELNDKVLELEQSERRALEATRAKSTFLANMSHELRTPLNAILGFVQLMERSSHRPPDDREYLAIIGRSGEHLLTLINDVLSLSKIEAGQLTLNERPFDLKRLITGLEEMFRLRAGAKRITLAVEVDPSLPQFVRGDDAKLRQVLINLLGNAVKFTSEGGVALRVKFADGRCAFEVSDTGPGIAPEETSKLFEAFVQTRTGRAASEGTGLGLAISRSNVELMGGTLTVASEVGKGSAFSFDIPVTVVSGLDLGGESRRILGLAPGQRVPKILAVDDKADNRLLLVRLLETAGFDVREAVNGQQAVEVWQEWNPDLIWMDIQMPVMDGYEATRRIRELSREGERPQPTTIIALTASAFDHDRDAILAAGCDDFVSKPYRDETIFQKIAEFTHVEFEVETQDTPGDEAPMSVEAIGTRLARLPSDLVTLLGQALQDGDIEAAHAAVDRVGESDPELARQLHQLVKAYRFDDVLLAIEQL